ncbi:LOW QUALITY PROTEIN: uncharacterized protein LOC110020631 [Phalaenopsis equestris]|uniref:LOW QUALITY PROTEIN: uncharacterized protein LOC110020631 n=1 Tax=Phalaenopsis equestris TaxID=78828 RepID=UPI0009E1A3C7|nr:LOW QUALITY PROTEIN: uncharacterized protein LOC110020631 [Phalaenopsis equestris]
MEAWWPRSLERHLKAILSSSRSFPFSFAALTKTRSLHTLSPVLTPLYNLQRPFFPLSPLRPTYRRRPLILRLFLFRPYAFDHVSAFSSVSLGQEFDWKNHHHRQQQQSASEDEIYDDHLLESQQAKQGRFIPVKAYFLCTSIDLRSLQSQNAFNVIPPSSRATNYVVLRYYDFKGDQGVEFGSLNESKCHYMIVFQYGSVVLFNVSEHEADGYLKVVEKHASGLLPEMRKDDYAVVEKPTLDVWMQGGLDYIILKTLSIDGIRTIGSVLGQSIALDYYIRQVDGMVAEFTDINRGMEKTGTFTMQRKKLFQLVGKANSNMADVILKLGLFERTDIAWRNANYAQIWEYLRDEYELSQRFGNLDFKLKFVEHNIRFLQEILENRKSVFLEWLIIVLIGVEILLSVFSIAQGL